MLFCLYLASYIRFCCLLMFSSKSPRLHLSVDTGLPSWMWSTPSSLPCSHSIWFTYTLTRGHWWFPSFRFHTVFKFSVESIGYSHPLCTILTSRAWVQFFFFNRNCVFFFFAFQLKHQTFSTNFSPFKWKEKEQDLQKHMD